MTSKAIIKCIINRDDVETALPPGTATLDFLREHLGITGVKEGCREGECGACTVLIGKLDRGTVKYKAVASCMLPVGELEGKHVVTVEGLNREKLTPVQQAFVDFGGTQCGFCTPGFVMSLTGFFLTAPVYTTDSGIDSLDGNICRCTGYASIRRAVQFLCDTYGEKLDIRKERASQLIEWGMLPEYFAAIRERLEQLETEIENENERLTAEEPGDKILVAGGTDLYIQKPDELTEKEIRLLSGMKQLNVIRSDSHWIYLGAGVTAEEMKQSPVIRDIYPKMPKYLNLVSSTIMRNRATLGGNIVNASPIGDLSVILLALNADLTLVKGKTKRQLPLKDFFKGYKKLDLKKDELIETIELPICPWAGDIYFHFEKVSQRRHLDIASCNSAIFIRVFEGKIDDIHISAGGVAPIPLHLEKTGAFMRGKEITGDTIARALEIAETEIAPISDVRGTADYKKLLLRNLVYGHFITLFPEKKLDDYFLEAGRNK